MQLSRILPLAALLAACSSADSTNDSLPLAPALGVEGTAAAGQVYTMSNATGGNEVLVFDRAADGSLSAAGAYATGGTGTGGGLGNQSALALAPNGRVLLVVNAGSHELSSFAVRRDGSLDLVSTVPSGGMMPVSVTASGSTVYVLNAGGTGNITGFALSSRGVLSPISGATSPLSSPTAGAAQVAFSPNGRFLVVTEKATNVLSVYAVQPDGTTSGPTVVPSSGATPFGFAFRGSVLVVSEAFGGAPDASAASSYEVRRNGTLELITASEPTTETAACWIAFSLDGRFAYTTNTGSGTITGYAVQNGRLSRLDADGVTAMVGAGTAPIDLATSPDGRFIYSLNAGTETIAGWAVNADGSLTPAAGGIAGLPNGANGLVAR
jgi:6-phosphogluconolactonase (cycloisomerase 2 family)